MADVQLLANENTVVNKLQDHDIDSAPIECILTKDKVKENNGSILHDQDEKSNDSKKRKATNDSDVDKTIKRSRLENNYIVLPTIPNNITSINEKVPSRPATPSKPTSPDSAINEDEWAAFEADIAATERLELMANTVISAPALSAEEIKQKSIEEEYELRREKEELQLMGDKEDAARKMEDELQKMELLEEKVKRLRAKREELRKKESSVNLKNGNSPKLTTLPSHNYESDGDNEDDDEDDDDESWNGLRLNK